MQKVYLWDVDRAESLGVYMLPEWLGLNDFIALDTKAIAKNPESDLKNVEDFEDFGSKIPEFKIIRRRYVITDNDPYIELFVKEKL